MTVARSIAVFLFAALSELGGAWLMWHGLRQHRGPVWVVGGALLLATYGAIATLSPDAHFGRVLAAYGGVFIVGSLVWAMVADGFRPDRWDIAGAGVCLVGVSLIMFAPRSI